MGFFNWLRGLGMGKTEKLPWMATGKGYMGTKEVPGPVDNPQVVGMFALAGFSGVKDDETAWCAAFVGACLRKNSLKASGSLAARSYEGWGLRLGSPVYGCVAVKKRTGGASWQGHVGFVVAANATTVWLLGGNQNNAVNVTAYARRDFTAFRWPLDYPLPKNPEALPTSWAGAASGGSEA